MLHLQPLLRATALCVLLSLMTVIPGAYAALMIT